MPGISPGGPPTQGPTTVAGKAQEGVPAGTLNTNISPRSTATVSKFPSQMSGPYWSGLSGLPGLGGRSGFPGGGGLGGLWSGLPGLRGVTVGKGLVGCGCPSTVPGSGGREKGWADADQQRPCLSFPMHVSSIPPPG